MEEEAVIQSENQVELIAAPEQEEAMEEAKKDGQHKNLESHFIVGFL